MCYKDKGSIDFLNSMNTIQINFLWQVLVSVALLCYAGKLWLDSEKYKKEVCRGDYGSTAQQVCVEEGWKK